MIQVRFLLIALLAALMPCAVSTAQPSPAPVQMGERPDEKTLLSIEQAIATEEALIKSKRLLMNSAPTPEERKAIYEEITATQQKLDGLTHDLTSIAVCVPYEEIAGMKSAEITLQHEVNDLLMPLLSGLKDATQQPRAIEALKSSSAAQKTRLKHIQTALDNVTIYLPTYEDEAVQKRLGGIKKTLEQQKAEVENRINILDHQLEDLNDNRQSIFAESTELFREYFRTRGWNLVLAMTVFVVIFFGSRLLHQHLHRFSPLHRPEKRSFYTRLADVLYYGLTFVGAIVAGQLVLYLRGDWMLLSLSILFLLGVALAAKHSLPKFYEQTRLMLNLGEVREGERVVINGVAWRVDALSFFSSLTNPALTGGRLRLPLRQMSTLVSRPFNAEEPWFPCKEDDWVMLDDGIWGKVLMQTPEQVQMVLLGGSRKTYGVESFLQNNPKNLSTGFRVTTLVGIDYAHQEKATTEIPALLKEHIQKGLIEAFSREVLVHLTVELASAAQNSLDIYISADLAGEAAPKHDQVQRLLQRLAVEACTEHDWKIPFPQIQIHVERGV